MPQTTAVSPTDALAESAKRDGPYGFLPRALRHLAAAPGDHRIRLLTFKHLLGLGLVGPAIELLDERPDLLDETPEVGTVREQIAGLPRNPIPWSRFRERFEANLAVLLERFPELNAWRVTLEAAVDDLELYECRDGNYQLSVRGDGRPNRWLPDLIDNHAAFNPEALKPCSGENVAARLLINHVRFGNVLRTVYDATQEAYLEFRPAVHVIEPNLDALAVCLHTADLQDILGDKRVHVWAGPEGTRRFVEHFERRQDLIPPSRIITQSTWTKELTPGDAMTIVANRRSRHGVVALRETRRLYAGRDRAWWARRFATAGPDNPLRIWGMASRATTVLQYSMRGAARACEALGHRFRLLVESDDHGLLPQSYILRSITDFQPDLILSLDHLRYEMGNLVPRDVPFCCWLQDPLPNLLCREAGESIGEFDLPFGYFYLPCIKQHGYPPDRFLPTVIPVSTAVFHDAALDETNHARYTCDICYASNASTPLTAFKASAFRNYPDSLHPVLEHIYRGALAALDTEGYGWAQDVAMQLVRTASAETDVRFDEDTEHTIWAFFAQRLLDWGVRQRTLEWVANWARRTGRVFKLYGKGWENHPTLSSFAAGKLEHGEPLRSAYRGARLGLQLNGFRHQRTFEMVASGCLPLNRYLPGDFDNVSPEAFARRRDAGEYVEGGASFFPKLERVTFRTAAEFEATAERFLADEAHYRDVYASLREVVIRDYTYETIMAKVIDAMREKLAHPDRPVWVEPAEMRERRAAREQAGAVTCLSPRPAGRHSTADKACAR